MEDKVKELQEQLGAAQLREAALKEAIEEKDALIDEKDGQIEQLSDLAAANDPSVSEPTKPSVPTQTAEIEGEEYAIVVAAFWHNGKYYLSAEAIKNTELMTELIDSKSGIIKIIND